MELVKNRGTFTSAFCLAALCFCLCGCGGHGSRKENTRLEDIAGSEEALSFMKNFEGRGVLSDSSTVTSPGDALATFDYPGDLALDLVLSEPQITQPIYMCFDHKGRLWVVQYNQYPYPEGLKVVGMDQHIRAQYDKVLPPPPGGVKGADKITFFEDTDGDGTFDKATDAITGLNIATSVALGRGRIWVMDPPYLLSYPDSDDNGVPDGPPDVHLEGFGIEDTHAVANNLRWGPDGWLYGAQGSTCTANVSSSVSRNVRFDGQAIWRYHPETHVFEIFAEGGGNTFDVEIDDKGRIFSGDNGITRGRYYKQGAYYLRNLGKHGAFTNPYALGNLPDMELTGDKVRFTHALIRYQEQNLPLKYHDHMIAINPMLNFLQLSRFDTNGSTFRMTDESRILQTKDHWFRPVDITTGPDGAIYLCDWYDSRLSHVDPRDTWSKSTGRIYRLRGKDKSGFPKVDFAGYPMEHLIQTLSSSSRWHRQQALAEFGNRKDKAAINPLKDMLERGEGQPALEALWAINLSGGFDDAVATTALQHKDPFVRMWGVRLLGDANDVSPSMSTVLLTLSSEERHPEVRSQLAATAKRLPGHVAIPMIKNLVKNHDDSEDPDIPLQIWWALESKAISNQEEIVAMFEDRSLWSNRALEKTILPRLMQRWIMEGGDKQYIACARLLKLAPSPAKARPLIDGIEEGLRGKDITVLSQVLVDALKPLQEHYGKEALSFALRQGQSNAVGKALEIIAEQEAPIGERLLYIRIFGEIHQPESVPVLLRLVESSQSSGAVRQASLEALSRYSDPEIGTRVTRAYPDRLRSDPDVRLAALSLLSLRSAWAHQLLDAIDPRAQPENKSTAHSIEKTDVPEQIARQLTLLNDKAINETVDRLWPDTGPATPSEKNKRIAEVIQILKTGKGEEPAGMIIYNNRCGSCHRLFGEGGSIGPDLTGYDRRNIDDMLTNIIDPNAYIREGYVAYHITTTDKRSLVGTLKAKHGSTITIQPFSGEPVNLNMDQVQEMVEQKVSVMPEGLLDGLTDQQIRDLLSYLAKDADN